MLGGHGKPGRFFLIGLVLVLTVFAADQASKWIIMEHTLRLTGEAEPFAKWLTTINRISPFVTEREVFSTIAVTPWFNLVMVWNQGISFGMFNSASTLAPIIFISLSVLISLFMMIWMTITPSLLQTLALALITGGAIGNALDRLRFGAVIDFLDLYAGKLHWPAFNVADSGIVVGGALLMIAIMLSDKNKTVPAND